MSWKDERYAAAAKITREEQLNILEAERRMAEMNGEDVPMEPEEGDIDSSGQYIYTRTGTTPWGTPVMRWKPWGLRV